MLTSYAVKGVEMESEMEGVSSDLGVVEITKRPDGKITVTFINTDSQVIHRATFALPDERKVTLSFPRREGP